MDRLRWQFDDGGEEMNEQFNNFSQDAIFHLNGWKIANLLFPLVKLPNRTAQVRITGKDNIRNSKPIYKLKNLIQFATLNVHRDKASLYC